MLRGLFHLFAILALTVVTQLGGLAWAFSLLFRRRLLSFAAAYVALSFAALWIAPMTGRVALNCLANGPLQVQSWLYCATNRTYVSTELVPVLDTAARELDRRYPGTTTLVLDGNFPFLNGFPLLPHLSHDDGGKVDLALFYRDETGFLNGKTRSPIGYFAFQSGPSDCPVKWPTMRWNMDALQGLWADYALEPERTRALLDILASDARVGKIFLEPHLKRALNLSHAKIRFQGCRAARHDDHIHLQL